MHPAKTGDSAVSRTRTTLIVSACCFFWAAVGAVLGLLFRHPLAGLIWGLLLGGIYVVACSYAAPKFPGDVWGATLLENSEAPHLYEMLHALCDRTGQALPTLFYCPRPEPNAFVSAGRDGETAIVVTSGLTKHLEKDEVQAVMALMVARLATGEAPAWTLAATLVGVPVAAGLAWQRRPNLAVWGNPWLSLFAFPAAFLTRLAWDEKALTASDYHAAHLTEQAGSLARALEKIELGLTEEGAEAGNPATALLFAVPPLLPLAADAPTWRRGLEAFPFRSPDASTRAARFADVVPSYVPEPVEEFHFF